MKRKLLASLLVQSGAAPRLQHLVRWSGVLGLNYHRIGNPRSTSFDRGVWSATPEDFDRQLAFLKLHTDVIGVADLPTVVSRGRGRSVLITFDDGYADNYTDAFPILRRHGLSATFFITTGFVDSPRLPWWDEIAWMVRSSSKRQIEVPRYVTGVLQFDEPDREGAVRVLLETYKTMLGSSTGGYLDALGAATGTGRYDPVQARAVWMTWDMVRELKAGGMTIGGHTMDHPVLSQLTPAEQRAQIAGCGERLATELGERMRWFAYPVGLRHAFNDATRACLRECDVEFGFSYYGGFRTFAEWDQFDVRRLAVDTDQSFDEFRAMVLLPHLFGRAR